MRSQHEPCLQVLTKVLLACLWVWRATAASPEVETGRPPGQPLYNLEFEVEGVVFHNKSLGLDRSFDVLGHQCSPGRPAQPDARLTYTPNRRWPSDARHGRTALVVLIGGPLQRFADRMKVGADSRTFCLRVLQGLCGVLPVLNKSCNENSGCASNAR